MDEPSQLTHKVSMNACNSLDKLQNKTMFCFLPSHIKYVVSVEKVFKTTL
jgi:hypothetical protein